MSFRSFPWVTAAVAAGVALVTSACSSVNANGERLEGRAPFDLHCSKEQIRWTQLSDQAWGAEGCGHRATYVEACSGFGVQRSCQWVLNGKD
jgi:hypothetical protein